LFQTASVVLLLAHHTVLTSTSISIALLLPLLTLHRIERHTVKRLAKQALAFTQQVVALGLRMLVAFGFST
jgi:energy-converting hydrogenase Eha subunit A